MNTSRRAVSRGSAGPALRFTIGVLTGALALVVSALAALSLKVARRIVTPAVRTADLQIRDLDTRAQTITLDATDDTRLPGRYGLFTSGTEDYLKLGSLLREADGTVTRKLLTEVDADTRLGRDAAFSGWYYDRPEQLHLPFSPQLIGTPIGPCPAWLFPAADDADLWVVHVHGRGTTRAETLRAVPLFHEAGATSLVVSYRNDGEAPRSRTGTYGLGATEWRDVDTALGFARRHGAKRLVLMGWSMGGAIALQTALHSAHRESIVGVVLDSPVVDWRGVLGFQAALSGLPVPFAELAMSTLGTTWGARLTGTEGPISFDRLDVVARAEELSVPMLVLHSEDDGFVPADGSKALAAARADLVQLELFEVARHTKLWNYDQARWEGTIRTWLDSHGLTRTAV